MRKINKIILHCSATKEGQYFDVKDIDRWHKNNGWAGVGYHYVVLLDGTIQVGRFESKIGAHTKGLNTNSIGVCYIGGLDAESQPKDTRTPEQKKSIINLVKELETRYPEATVHGHNEFAAKACPSFNVQSEIELYRL